MVNSPNTAQCFFLHTISIILIENRNIFNRKEVMYMLTEFCIMYNSCNKYSGCDKLHPDLYKVTQIG